MDLPHQIGLTMSRKCLHNANGIACKAWSMKYSELPRCSAHRLDGGPKGGAPASNKNRQTHGFYSVSVTELNTIDDVIRDTLNKQARLSDYLNQEMNGDEKMKSDTLLKLVSLHGQNASRLGRLLRDQRILSGGADEELLELLGETLDELGEEWDVAL